MSAPSAVGAVLHPHRDSRRMLEQIVAWAAGHDKVVIGLEEERELLPGGVEPVSAGELSERAELVIAMGGDGTILRGLALAAPHDVPVLGVNLGRLAFLAEVALADLPDALEAISRGDYEIEARATMAVQGEVEGLPRQAFNDAAITRIPGHGPAALAVEVEREVFGRYTADALVIATPTGSTAYSFAAGGPIVSPRHRGLLVTPVAPHAAFDRAVFLHPDESLDVHVLERSAPILIEVDGRRAAEVVPGETISFRVHERSARILRLHKTGFYERARVKLQLIDSAELAPDGAAGLP